jgi:hypothetical protein
MTSTASFATTFTITVIASTKYEAIHIYRRIKIMGTFIVSIILLVIVALVIHSLIKSKRAGKHPSCGGNCGACGHACSAAYPHAEAFFANHKSSKGAHNNSCLK